jgi:30S ribosomal protein 3|tara:strand:- start:26905 stop:27213 length:309 start_codon:yes stop_codon:yes gene_type:complete
MTIASNNFSFKIIWLYDNLGIAIDKTLKNGSSTSITSFYFWPKQDSWKLLEYELSAKPWMLDEDRLFILNRVTSLINFWKKPNSNIVELLKSFPDVILCGSD